MTEQSETVQKYNIGDEITVMRGLERGKTAEVIGVDSEKEQYAIKFTDNSFAVVNFVNAKAPVEGTISASPLATIVATAGPERDDVVSALSKAVDGFAKAYKAADLTAVQV